MLLFRRSCTLRYRLLWALTEGYVSKEEHEAVIKFYEVADNYNAPANDDYDQVAILNDPAWKAVVHAAQVAQNQLEKLLVDPNEKAILERAAENLNQWDSLEA